MGALCASQTACGKSAPSTADGASIHGDGGAAGNHDSAAADGGDGLNDSISTGPDPVNPICPQVRPLDGAYAPKGKCCYRVANSTRIQAQGDGPLDTIQYRIAYQQTVNHPRSVGLDAINTVKRG